jgi:hypothetical protein
MITQFVKSLALGALGVAFIVVCIWLEWMPEGERVR